MAKTEWKGLKKGSPEYREKDRQYRRGVRATERAEQDIAAKQPESDAELKKYDAVEILRDRGLRNLHIIDTVVGLAETASKHFKIPFNDFLLRNGLRHTLAVRDGGNCPVAPEPNQIVDGELIYSQDLFALWDFGYFRHPTLGPLG